EHVDPALRRTDLPFSHHQAVAALDPDQQKRLLARAAPRPDDEHRRPRMSVRELEAEVRSMKQTAKGTLDLDEPEKPEKPEKPKLTIVQPELPTDGERTEPDSQFTRWVRTVTGHVTEATEALGNVEPSDMSAGAVEALDALANAAHELTKAAGEL